jgi:hypothetical protein
MSLKILSDKTFTLNPRSQIELLASPSGPDGGFEKLSIGLKVTLPSGLVVEAMFPDVVDRNLYLKESEETDEVDLEKIKKRILKTLEVEFALQSDIEETAIFEADIGQGPSSWHSSSTASIRGFATGDISGQAADTLIVMRGL